MAYEVDTPGLDQKNTYILHLCHHGSDYFPCSSPFSVENPDQVAGQAVQFPQKCWGQWYSCQPHKLQVDL